MMGCQAGGVLSQGLELYVPSIATGLQPGIQAAGQVAGTDCWVRLLGLHREDLQCRITMSPKPQPELSGGPDR